MTKKLKQLSESWIIEILKVVIGTLTLVVISVSAFTFNRALDKLDKTEINSQNNTKNNIGMCKDIESNKALSKYNRERGLKNKDDITAIKYRINF